eukprot:1843781-Prymnesium_polylepis.1
MAASRSPRRMRQSAAPRTARVHLACAHLASRIVLVARRQKSERRAREGEGAHVGTGGGGCGQQD